MWPPFEPNDRFKLGNAVFTYGLTTKSGMWKISIFPDHIQF